MKLSLYNSIAIGLIYSAEAIYFEALAFGNREFSVESAVFSNFQETNILIRAGDASLIVPPTKGTLKSVDCSDSIDINDSIQIQNELLTFCYEGGREMLSGGTDTFTLEVNSTNNSDSVLFTINLIGSDPVKPRPLKNRVLELLEDELFSVSPGLTLVDVDPEATELSDFIIRFEEVAPQTQISLLDFSGLTLIVPGSIVRIDTDLRASGFDRFANCAVGGFDGLLDCDEIINSIDLLANILDHFTVRIGFIGNDDAEIVFSEPFDFFYTVRRQTGSIISPEIFPVPVNSRLDTDFIAGNTDFVTLLPDLDEAETFFEIQFTVLSGQMRITSGFGLNVFRFGPECAELGDPCFLILKGRPDDLNEYIENQGPIFVFDVNDIANCIVEVQLNLGEQINIVQFSPAGSDDEIEEQSDIEDQPDEEPVEEYQDEPIEEPGQPDEPIEEPGQPDEQPQEDVEDTNQDEPEDPTEEEPEDPQNQPTDADPNIDNGAVEGALIGVLSGTGVLVVVILLSLIGYLIIKAKKNDNSEIPQGTVVTTTAADHKEFEVESAT